MESAESSTPPWQETPLAQALTFLPVLGAFLWKSTLYILQTLVYYPLSILRIPVLAPFAILLYVFAPAIVFVQVILDVVVFIPYRACVYFVDALYPLYVFCGVACITGVLIGGLGRALASWTTMIAMDITNPRQEKDDVHEIEGGLEKPQLEFTE
ncbi:hypothetical protein PQX77_003782 [Marasmius sp. AFHP31]|nr:hypothetical protein PQX77_003782 [Marasmius sp. AFHP31]